MAQEAQFSSPPKSGESSSSSSSSQFAQLKRKRDQSDTCTDLHDDEPFEKNNIQSQQNQALPQMTPFGNRNFQPQAQSSSAPVAAEHFRKRRGENLQVPVTRQEYELNTYRANMEVAEQQSGSRQVLRQFLHLFTEWNNKDLMVQWEHNMREEYSRKKYRIPFMGNKLQIDDKAYVGSIELVSEEVYRHCKRNVRWEHDTLEHVSWQVYDIVIQDEGRTIVVEENHRSERAHRHREVFTYTPIGDPDFSERGQAWLHVNVCKWYDPDVMDESAVRYPSGERLEVRRVMLTGRHVKFVHDVANRVSYQVASFEYAFDTNQVFRFSCVRLPYAMAHTLSLVRYLDDNERLVSTPIYEYSFESPGYFGAPPGKIVADHEVFGRPEPYTMLTNFRIFTTYARPGRKPGDHDYKYTRIF